MTRHGPRWLVPAGSAAGIVLRDARIAAGVTQGQLARLARTQQSAISRIECGTISPTVETLERTLSAMGYTLILTATKEHHAETEP